MRKNELTNRRLVSALTVGISAMMALATPITAYANGEPTAPPDDTPDTTTEGEALVSEDENAPAITEQAEEQAEVVQEAVAGEEKQTEEGEQQTEEGEQQTEAGEQQLQSAAVEAEAAAQEILTSENAAIAGEAGTSEDNEANKAIENVIEAASAIVNDSEDGDPSALSSLDAAADKAEEVKQDLNDAGEADKEASAHEEDMINEARAAFEDAKYATEKAEHMVLDSIETQEKADALIESIKEAATEEEANKAYNDLEKLANDTKSTLDAMKEFYDNLTRQYEAATANLKAAEEKMELAEKEYGDKINSAEEKTQEVQKDIEDARKKVDNLAEALDIVGDKLEDAQEADNLKQTSGDNWNGKIGGNIQKNRGVMESVVENYFLTQKLGIDVVQGPEYEIKWQYIKDGTDNDEGLVSIEKQEYNAAKVTFYYRDDAGEIQKGTKYFNWDSIEKAGSDSDWHSGAKSTNGNVIVVYEKTEEELGATRYLNEKYKSIIKNTNKLKTMVYNGELDGYVYEDNGAKVYKAIDEINEMIAAGTIGKNDDGSLYIKDADGNDTGVQLHKVVQNQNNLFHNADCLVVGNDNRVNYYANDAKSPVSASLNERLGSDKLTQILEDSAALNKFINGQSTKDKNAAALADKYAGFETATEKAQQAVTVAQQEAEKLVDAIDDLKNQKKRSVLAVNALGVEDVATYFNLEVDQQRADELNQMTVKEVIKELDKMLDESNKKVETAQNNLAKLQEGFGQARTDLDNALLRLNPVRPVTVDTTGDIAGVLDDIIAAREAADSKTPAPAAVVTPDGAPAPAVVTPDETPAPAAVVTPDETPAPAAVVTPDETPAPAPAAVTPDETPAPAAVTPDETPAPAAVPPDVAPAAVVVTPDEAPAVVNIPDVAPAAAVTPSDEVPATQSVIPMVNYEAPASRTASAPAAQAETPVVNVAPASQQAAVASAEAAVQEAASEVVDQRRAARQASENAQSAGGDEVTSEDAGAGETTTIEDGSAALADTSSTETGEVREDVNAAAVSIEDEETAKGILEDAPVKEDNIGFWWLLLIALFGEAGREMYVKHKKKQEEKARIDE